MKPFPTSIELLPNHLASRIAQMSNFNVRTHVFSKWASYAAEKKVTLVCQDPDRVTDPVICDSREHLRPVHKRGGI